MQVYIEDCKNPAPLEAREQEDTLDKFLKARNPD